ncbi:TonB-dependent receptor [Solimicrobium silvestre]|uniref:TonB-dependent Receptor Plug Domain n=1 Tax=Solimicrobium silvestre TaxID=2099400 RepID=A0A2S9GU71_9BURK|nr:TonB-dependent receptor [Solimicrobium silvestre]PRC91206.1 TonB-dependent Receptor Plug Domain [Solimicrobium silvestre]
MQRTSSTLTRRKLSLAIAGILAASSGYSTLLYAADPAATPPLPAETPTNSANTVVITAPERLKSARTELLPNIGTTVYSVDKHMIDSLGQGDSTPFDDVLLRMPGVVQDSKASGSLHIRDDHGNVQYRINGVELPEGISGFGQAVDTRFIDNIDFVTGALPAQYGLRTAGIIDIQTKEGSVEPGGRIGMLIGSNHYVEPSAEVFGSRGAFNYYLSGSYLQNSIGIENPTASKNPIHDDTHQTKSFGNLSYYLNDDSRISLLFGTYDGKFQIPNNPNQTAQYSLTGYSDLTTGFNSVPSSSLNERQNEENRFMVLSYQKTLGNLNFQISGYHQYSETLYTPDVAGDLIYNGIAAQAMRNSSSNGLQFDTSYKLNAQHTVRGGFAYNRQDTESNNSSQVFPIANGVTSADPVTIIDNSSKTGTTGSFYMQDQWTITKALTFNYGARYDQVSAFIQEHQWSPRLNLAFKATEDTALHAGYSRYFTPPSQELLSQNSIDKYAGTTGAANVPTSDPVKAERTNYFDMGISHKVNAQLSVTADVYYKQITNLLDEGQFGQALILSPFNYAKGYAKGLELSAIYNEKNWGGFLNLSAQKAQGTDIISGQATFGPDELAYIANHYVYLDHDQTFSISGGANTKLGDYKLSGDFIYGSGLRNTPTGGAPNSASLPDYITFNSNITRTWKDTAIGSIEGRIALLNIFDRSYELRDGTGIGVGAPQYGARRTLFVGMSTSF